MKRNKQGILALIVVSALLVCLFSACGGGSGTAPAPAAPAGQDAADNAPAAPAPSSDSKEIVFWNIATESPDKEYYQRAVDTFNSTTQSGYHATNVAIQNDTYKEKLVIAMSSGECPDVYISWSGGPMNEYVDAGFAQPLDDLIAAAGVKDVLMDAAWAQATYNGKIYSVPSKNLSIAGVFYNKEMFEKYGLSIPKTVSELEAACDTLKSNGITPFALANASKWTGSMYFMSLATRFGGIEPFNKAADGSGSFVDESYKYAGEKIQDWVKKGYFPDGVNSLSEDDGQAKQLMYQETAAMLLCGSWYTGTFNTDSPEFYQKIGWFSFPAVDGSSADASIQIGTIGDQFHQISCTGEKLDAAFEMATQFLTPESLKYLAEECNKIPVSKNAAELVSGADEVTKEIMKAALNASATQLWYDQYLPPAVAEVHKDTCQEIFGLTMTPDQANTKLQEAMQSYLSKK